MIPARPEPLRVTQEGSDVVLRFPFPSKTVQGAPLTNLTRVTVDGSSNNTDYLRMTVGAPGRSVLSWERVPYTS